MDPGLDNIFWHAMTGAPARYAEGAGGARRLARGFLPIVAFAEPDEPDFAALEPYCAPGEHFYCDGWSGPAVAGWRIASESTMYRMVWTAAEPPPDDVAQLLQLGPQHAAQALALAQLTRPGPFGPRSLELGEYFGWFEGGQLVAMAGERMHAGTLREISGVCTRPAHRGRGWARRLITKLVRRQLQRGETPCLHVMRDNGAAHRLYAQIGFRDHRETPVRVISLS
jgi:ribosomal protein S18 acetylase RimI-like enzyme